MSCPEPTCRLVTCQVTDDLPSYFGQFNLQGAGFVNGLIVIAVPSNLLYAYPSGFYTAAPGTITIPITTNPGGGQGGFGSANSISYQGCLSTVSAIIPSGATTQQIQSIVAGLMQQIAAQQMVCDAPPPPNNNPPIPIYYNEVVFSSCSKGDDVKIVGSIPPNVTLSGNQLGMQSGVFSSIVSQADADQQAVNFLNSLFGTVVLCGWWNQAQSTSC